MPKLTFQLQANRAVLELKLGEYMVGETGPIGPAGPPGPEGTLTPDDTATLDAAVASAQASANAAAGSATSASQSATTATNQAGQAQTAQQGAASSATAASQSASNAAGSATAAGNSATAAANSATAAAGSATTAGTSATNAANSASAAAGSATAANTSATNAASSATAAGNSATNAAASATAAANSAGNASATLAASLLKANNLSDVQNAAQACANIGAVLKTGDTMSGPLTFSAGGILVFADGSQQASADQSNHNLFVDGNFDSWYQTAPYNLTQGLGASISNMCWQSAGTGGVAVAQGNQFPPGYAVSNGLADCANWYLSHQQTTASSGSLSAYTGPRLERHIEGVKTAAGRSVTFYCWLSSNAPMTVTQVLAFQYFGTGGSSPSATNIFPVTVNWQVTSTLKRYSVRIDAPSISGKTLGTNNNDYFSVGLALPVGQTFTIYTTQWQLKYCSPNASPDINGNGGSPVPFEYLGPQQEFARVNRYLNIMPCPLVSGYTSAGNTVYQDFIIPTMRATPASSAGGMTYVNSSNLQFQIPSVSSLREVLTVTNAGYGFAYGGTLNLDARL